MRVIVLHHRNQRAVGGQPNVLELGCPREGAIDKIVVVQTGGTAVAFTYDVYSRRAAADTFGSGSSADNSDTPADEGMALTSLYRVNGTTVTAASGQPGTFEPTAPVKYRNADAGNGMTRARQRIYLVLTPEGSGDMSFDVCITGLTPQNS